MLSQCYRKCHRNVIACCREWYRTVIANVITNVIGVVPESIPKTPAITYDHICEISPGNISITPGHDVIY